MTEVTNWTRLEIIVVSFLVTQLSPRLKLLLLVLKVTIGNQQNVRQEGLFKIPFLISSYLLLLFLLSFNLHSLVSVSIHSRFGSFLLRQCCSHLSCTTLCPRLPTVRADVRCRWTQGGVICARGQVVQSSEKNFLSFIANPLGLSSLQWPQKDIKLICQTAFTYLIDAALYEGRGYNYLNQITWDAKSPQEPPVPVLRLDLCPRHFLVSRCKHIILLYPHRGWILHEWWQHITPRLG